MDGEVSLLKNNREPDVVCHCVHVFITNLLCVSASRPPDQLSAGAATLDQRRHSEFFNGTFNGFVLKYAFCMCASAAILRE